MNFELLVAAAPFVMPWLSEIAAAASVPLMVPAVAFGSLNVKVIVHEPFAGIVRPVAVAVPLVAGNVVKATPPPHEVAALVTENDAPDAPLSAIAKWVLVIGAEAGFVTVYVCVAVADANTVVVAEPAVVKFAL